jgi:hypothetical protein
MKGVDNVDMFSPERCGRCIDIHATLDGLYRLLDDAGREELATRAVDWPEHLRAQVSIVIA